MVASSSPSSADPSPIRVPAPPELDAAAFPALQRALERALEPDGARVVLDLYQTRYASPGALLMLRRLAEQARRRGRELAVRRTPPTIRAGQEALELPGTADDPSTLAFPEEQTPA